MALAGELTSRETEEATTQLDAFSVVMETLPSVGYDRQTPAKVESIFCPTALCSHC